MDERTKRTILDIVNSAPGDDNGKYGASVGNALKEAGIDYKALGYLQLKDLFESIPELRYSSVQINGGKAPVGYVSINSDAISPTTKRTDIKK